MTKTVQCKVHGVQQLTLVCQHILDGLNTKKRVGFFWTSEDSKPETRRLLYGLRKTVRATGGEWVGEALNQLQPKVYALHAMTWRSSSTWAETRGREAGSTRCVREIPLLPQFIPIPTPIFLLSLLAVRVCEP